MLPMCGGVINRWTKRTLAKFNGESARRTKLQVANLRRRDTAAAGSVGLSALLTSRQDTPKYKQAAGVLKHSDDPDHATC